MENNIENKGEIIIYHPDNTLQLDVRLEDATVWLTQAQMVRLFDRDRTVITKHINNIFREGELDKKSNVHFLHIANSDKPITLYNLDVIISVGYRIKSPRGTQFRIWAREITIVLIDNFVDESVLILLSKRESGVNAMIITRKISEQLQLDLTKHNAQYPPIAIEERPNIHDRFLLIDNDLYHIGASLKDLGKKLFAFSKMEMMAKELLKNIYAVNDFKK